jgi:hypothetical protein
MDIARLIADQMPLAIAILLVFAGGYGMASGRDAFRIVTGSFVLILGASMSVVFLGSSVSTVAPIAWLLVLALILTGLGLSAFFVALSARRIKQTSGKKDTRIGGSRP